MNSQYPHLKKFSKDIGIPEKNLIEAFKIEKVFHQKILAEKSFSERKKLYSNVYNEVHLLYEKDRINTEHIDVKNRIVQLFKKELNKKSILDIGCGNGEFLKIVADKLDTEELVGLDISKGILPKSDSNISFVNSDIINFKLRKKFDVV
ncbi:MAG: class I SAM-dependent methyltransferase, partial [Promethearchaeota archaeon]